MWQDAILSVGTLALAVFLLPTLYATAKPPLATSIPTAAILLAFTVTHATLGLRFASAATALMTVEWAALSAQRYRQINQTTEEEE